MDIITYALLKKYVNDSLIGVGALKGAPAQIQSITPIEGGNRVTFAWKDDNGVTHTSTMDVADGAIGPIGPKGDKGDTGERGVDGEAGPAGRTATVQVGTVSSGTSPSIENVGTNNDAIFNFVLPKGEKGDKGEDGEDGQDGKSFDIKGQYPNYDALIAAHPTGSAGEAYFVGTDNNPDLYIWLTDDAEWYNNGKIAGVKGDKGDKGDAGFSPIASVSKSGDTATIVIRDETGQTTAQIKDGEKGDPGVGEPVFNGTQAQWDGLTLEQKLEYQTGMVVINDDYDDSEYVKAEDIGTAAAKDATDRVSPNNTALVESQSVYSAINTALSSIYTPAGDISCAELTSEMLIAENVGKVYELSDAGTTTDLFLQGAGKPLAIGDNVGIINAGQGRILFNLMANRIDLSTFQKKDLTQAVEGASTVEGALGVLSTNKQPKTLDTPITVDGVQKTTVESALSALVSKKMYYSIATANDPTAIETNFKTLMPQGVNLVFWQKGGSHELLIVQNTDADYYSYVWFSYGQPIYQRIHTPAGWSTVFNGRDTYSTNETLTNKVWNGKPIYRKVIHHAGVVASGSGTLIGNVTGFADVITFEGTFRNNVDGNCFPIGYTYSNFGSTVVQNMPFTMGNNGNIYANPYGFDISNINVVVEYTKTTD